VKLCQLFRHPQNWLCSSSSQHEIPVLSTNLTLHFQTFETTISRLTSVLAFAIIFDTISKNKRHKTHLRYNCSDDSRYDKTEFLTLDRTTCLELLPIKLTVRTLPATGNFSGRQTDRQTGITCSSEFCMKTLWLLRNIKVWKYVSTKKLHGVRSGTVVEALLYQS
jgi:hypothetical protein